jgi:hypothetical protein
MALSLQRRERVSFEPHVRLYKRMWVRIYVYTRVYSNLHACINYVHIHDDYFRGLRHILPLPIENVKSAAFNLT